MTCKTYADFRNEAIEAEKRCEWGRAADFWQAAMDNYPVRPLRGALAKADVKRMEERMNSCLSMYFPK